MKRLFGKKKAKGNQEIALNITAMADVFTIILVFLIKSFTTGASNISPSAGLLLPEAQAQSSPVEALKIEIAQNGILVEGKVVTPLQNFILQSNDRGKGGSSQSLSQALKKERERQIAIAKANPSVKLDAKVLIIADQRAPYATIKVALASAALNSYTDFKLAVVQKE